MTRYFIINRTNIGNNRKSYYVSHKTMWGNIRRGATLFISAPICQAIINELDKTYQSDYKYDIEEYDIESDIE